MINVYLGNAGTGKGYFVKNILNKLLADIKDPYHLYDIYDPLGEYGEFYNFQRCSIFGVDRFCNTEIYDTVFDEFFDRLSCYSINIENKDRPVQSFIIEADTFSKEERDKTIDFLNGYLQDCYNIYFITQEYNGEIDGATVTCFPYTNDLKEA